MKTLLTAAILLAAMVDAFAQPEPAPQRQLPERALRHPGVPVPVPPAGGDFKTRLNTIVKAASDDPANPELTAFNLDFPGGTPAELVAAIEKAMGRPLNVIIPEDSAHVKLPALKMNNVTAPKLFEALRNSSFRSVPYLDRGRPGSFQIAHVSYTFSTQDNPANADSVWYFRYEKPAEIPYTAPMECRFYSLAPYLDGGFKVDDITTAIQTGWRMMGDKETPQLTFHKDTKLLIAVGDPGKLQTIDSVLKALKLPPPVVDPATGLPVKPKPSE